MEKKTEKKTETALTHSLALILNGVATQDTGVGCGISQHAVNIVKKERPDDMKIIATVNSLKVSSMFYA